jgi:AraC-like DNA-binding protein
VNETAATSSPPGVWLGASSLLYVGPLPRLGWHAHPFACVLVSPHGPITVETHSGPRAAHVVLATPSVRHRLDFSSAPVASLYIPPHDPDFARLRHAESLDARTAPDSPTWQDAWASWRDGHDAAPLRRAALTIFSPREDHPPLDHRVVQAARALARGEHLRSAPDALAAELGLSASRLMHLLKDHTGATLSSLQRGYRFWRAAHAMSTEQTFTHAAHAADFADAAHFSRAFKNAYGIAPTRLLGTRATWARCESVG